MKLALIACLLAVTFLSAEAYWGLGYGGYYGGLYGSYYGGLWGGLYGGLYGGYGYGYWGKRDVPMVPPVDLMNRTECVYVRTEGYLSCHGPFGVVECLVNQTLPNDSEYEMFAFGLFEGENPETLRYRVLPRKLDNSAWTSGKYVDEAGVERFASLYSSSESGLAGLMVVETECAEKLRTEVLMKSNRREPVFVGDEEVTVVGDLMIAEHLPVTEKVNQKREEEEEDMEDEEERRSAHFDREMYPRSYPEQRWTRRSADFDREMYPRSYPEYERENSWTRREEEEEEPEEDDDWERRSADFDREMYPRSYPEYERQNSWTRREEEEEEPEEDDDWNRRSADFDREMYPRSYPEQRWTRRSAHFDREMYPRSYPEYERQNSWNRRMTYEMW